MGDREEGVVRKRRQENYQGIRLFHWIEEVVETTVKFGEGVQESGDGGKDCVQSNCHESGAHGIDFCEESREGSGNALKYIIVAPTNFYNDGRPMYWMGGLLDNVADWNWVHEKHNAKIFSSLAEAQSKAFYVATKFPRYFGHVNVEAIIDDAFEGR